MCLSEFRISVYLWDHLLIIKGVNKCESTCRWKGDIGQGRKTFIYSLNASWSWNLNVLTNSEVSKSILLGFYGFLSHRQDLWTHWLLGIEAHPRTSTAPEMEERNVKFTSSNHIVCSPGNQIPILRLPRSFQHYFPLDKRYLHLITLVLVNSKSFRTSRSVVRIKYF